ncbi:MAG: flippase [Anaerolineae bacterium]|nr:flippase [Anaerolineae bacterium]
MEESVEIIAIRIGKNVLSLLVSFVAKVVSGFLIVVVIARLSGVEEVGDWSTVIAFTWTFTALMDFGLNRLLVPEIAKRRDEADIYVSNSIALCILFGLIGWMAMALIVNWLEYPQRVIHAVYLAGLAQVLYVLAGLIQSAFRAFERMELETLSVGFQEAVFLVCAIGVLYFALPFLWIFVVYAFSRLAGVSSAWLLYRNHLGYLRPRLNPQICWELLIKGWPFAVFSALSMLYLRADVLLLSLFHGAAAVGYYEVAANLFLRLNVFARTVNTSLLPLLSREYAISGKEIRKYLNPTIKYQAILALPMTFGGLILAPQIIEFFYAGGYEASILLFQLLIGFVMLRFVDHTLGITLTAIGQQTRRVVALGGATAINLLLNAVLIPRYSYLGATMSSIFTEIFLFIALYLFLSRWVPGVIRLQIFIKPMLGAVVMSAPILILKNLPLPLLVPLGAATYILALFLLKSFSVEETRTILKLVEMLGVVPKPIRRRLADALLARSEG